MRLPELGTVRCMAEVECALDITRPSINLGKETDRQGPSEALPDVLYAEGKAPTPEAHWVGNVGQLRLSHALPRRAKGQLGTSVLVRTSA